MYIKYCKVCTEKFSTAHPNFLCCSHECSAINKVNTRYKRINGDWDAYFKHLLSTKVNSDLTPRKLINILKKQNYRCALSGMPLTCSIIRGVPSRTNVSIDRLSAGGVYNRYNVQLVCRAINSFRGNMTVDEFINWCKKVAKYAVCKQTKTPQKRVPTATRKRRA